MNRLAGFQQTADDPDGFPIDLTRPIVRDEEGVHTELTMTVEMDGKFFNIPTIWDGRRFDPAQDFDFLVNKARSEMQRGWEFPNFETEDDALRAARRRSNAIGPLRGLE